MEYCPIFFGEWLFLNVEKIILKTYFDETIFNPILAYYCIIGDFLIFFSRQKRNINSIKMNYKISNCKHLADKSIVFFNFYFLIIVQLSYFVKILIQLN